MNIKTGELFSNYKDGLEKALADGYSKAKAEDLIMPLNKSEYDELQEMNRVERRRWAKKRNKEASDG